MIAFLFEQYGYYPKEIINNGFVVGEWQFKLLPVDSDEKYIKDIDDYIKQIRDKFSNKGPHIISTRFGKLFSIYDNQKYVLVSSYKCNMSLKDLNKFHVLFRESGKKLEMTKLLDTWMSRVTYIEEYAISSLRIDSVYYKKNLETSMFSLGLAQNALQYLSDIINDYGMEIDDVTITHKRLDNLDSFDFFNPFNLVVDHPIRDLENLYIADFLNFDDLTELLQYYEMDKKVASLFMARLLYPCKILDLLESNIENKNSNFKIECNIEKELAKLKKIYEYLKQVYGIRPIEWLEYR